MTGPGLGYFASKAIKNFSRNLLVNVICIATIAISVFVFLSTDLIFRNMKSVVGQAARSGRVIVFIKDAAGPDEIAKLVSKMRANDLVSDVAFTSKDKALKDFRASLGVHSSIVEGLGFNPLPASLDVKLKPNPAGAMAAKAVSMQATSMEGVESVDYGRETIENLEMLLVFLGRLGTGIGVLMILAVIFIVANTIRLNIYSRREEIEVQQLVGAGGGFIRVPFLFEGAFQGVAGAVVAELLLLVVYAVFAGMGQTSVSTPFGIIEIEFLPNSFLIKVVLAGFILGLAGAWLSLGKYIKQFLTHE